MNWLMTCQASFTTIIKQRIQKQRQSDKGNKGVTQENVYLFFCKVIEKNRINIIRTFYNFIEVEKLKTFETI